MDLHEWNGFEERIATLVLMAQIPFRNAIAKACEDQPSKQADALLLGAISFVTHFDNQVGIVPDKPNPELLHQYRVLVVLSADIALLTGGRSCRDLLEVWRNTSSKVFVVT